jgi:hypothetical protein
MEDDLNLSLSDYIITVSPTPPTTPQTCKALQPRKLIFGRQPHFDQTRKNKSNTKMEDDLKKNGRIPKKKWMTISKKNGRRPKKKIQIEDNQEKIMEDKL